MPAQLRKHVPALDGLRAVAFLGVYLSHALYGHFKGGGLGVEVFFVLSGFLITNVLMRANESSAGLTFKRFYSRRAARLLPALLVVVVGVFLLYAFTEGTDRGFSATALVGVLFYAGNWMAAAKPGTLGLLGHTWSLSIEEQFYAVWPVMFWLFLRKTASTRLLMWAAVVIAAGSAVWRATLWHDHDRYGAYYRSDARGSGLMIGCALALALADHGVRSYLQRRSTTTIATAAATVLGGAFLLMYPITAAAMYGGLTVVGLATAVLISHAVLANTAITNVLSWRPLQWIGRRSYGLYLIHFPVVVYVTTARLHAGHVIEGVARIGLTFGGAAVLFRWVEQPVLLWSAPTATMPTHEKTDAAGVA